MEAAIRWSPHHNGHEAQYLVLDILNSSLTLNQVSAIDKKSVTSKELACFTKLPSFAAFDWSKTKPNIISLGHVSGSASVIRLNPEQQTLETLATYKAKQQRRCNSTALSIENWLAVALDKTRADLCLNIYDFGSTTADPVRRLCPAEFISSVRFFANQPHELLAGAQRAFVRLYDLRDGFAGGAGNLHVATKNVNNISIDPMDENYFAAGGSTDDPSVTVWDKRFLSNAATSPDTASVFEFRPAVDATTRCSIWALRYSGHRRGRLALSSSAGELKIIDMVEGKTVDAADPVFRPPNPHGGTSWSSKCYVQQSAVLEKSTLLQPRAGHGTSRIIAFDWASTSDHGQNIVALRADRTVVAFQVTGRPACSISSSNTLSVALTDMRLSQAAASADLLQELSRHSSMTATETQAGDEYEPGKTTLDVSDPLVMSLLPDMDTARDRCHAGYLFNCRENFNIVANDWQAKRLWETVDRLRALAAHDGMVYDAYDFSFVGINGLWNGQAIELSTDRDIPVRLKAAEAVAGLVEKREMPMFEGARTDFEDYRQLCLAVCGWKFTPEDLEAECNALIEQKLYYQAIVQAVLHGAKHLALNLLRTLIRGKTIQNIGLGALLAADTLNDEQREMTQWMTADTDDPALKALLTYLHAGDWRDVMKTGYLHMGYRMALGLKYLNDTDLHSFITTETARAIKNGDLEGVLLTGLTEQSMGLFQRYISRTNDLQTAVLATAFTNPRFVEDVRWSMWKETYFLHMQAWRAFAQRTRFTVEHNHLSKIKQGNTAVPAAQPGAKLRCLHCHNDISRHAHQDRRQSSQRATAASIAVSMGTVCPSCERPLPRCGVCTMWLGAADPRKSRSAVTSRHSAKVELMERMLVFCTKCDHGSHAHHAREWFDQYAVCPVPGCACQCSDKPLGQGFTMADLWQTSR